MINVVEEVKKLEKHRDVLVWGLAEIKARLDEFKEGKLTSEKFIHAVDEQIEAVITVIRANGLEGDK